MLSRQAVLWILSLSTATGTALILLSASIWLANRGSTYTSILIALWTQQISSWAMHQAIKFLEWMTAYPWQHLELYYWRAKPVMILSGPLFGIKITCARRLE